MRSAAFITLCHFPLWQRAARNILATVAWMPQQQNVLLYWKVGYWYAILYMWKNMCVLYIHIFISYIAYRQPKPQWMRCSSWYYCFVKWNPACIDCGCVSSFSFIVVATVVFVFFVQLFLRSHLKQLSVFHSFAHFPFILLLTKRERLTVCHAELIVGSKAACTYVYI